jgi:hypothetical protein
MQPSIYVRLTAEFNAGRLRAIISSGQAVVLHRLAIMSKDGDWILREDEEATRHVLTERRQLMRANEERLRSYLRAATGWRARWSELEPGLRGVPLRQVHERLVAAAEGCLPEVPDGIPS